MSYILREIPSHYATLSEIADFLEYQCIKNGNFYSIISGTNAMSMMEDIDNEEDSVLNEIKDKFHEALSEIEVRLNDTNGNYPFCAETNVIRKRDSNRQIDIVYTFLLLATRENMKNNKVANNIDGTLLFEKLCAMVLQNFFGNSSESLVFGTGSGITENFQQKIERMLNTISEKGYFFRNPDNSNNRQKDSKVDIVVFIPFSDGKKGQFMALGQCKTGTSWHASISQLQPKAFSESFISPSFVFTPIAVFMVCESFHENWEYYQRNSGGFIFDRERIMEYLPQNIDDRLLEEIDSWNRAVLARDN